MHYTSILEGPAHHESRTKVEEVYPSLVASDVEVVLQQAARFETQLRQIVPTIVSEEHQTTWFEHLHN